MPHRDFRDDAGREWQIWDVIPAMHREPPHDELPARLRDGWLAFQCSGELRRLTPIPMNWPGLSDAELAQLVAEAEPIFVRPTRHEKRFGPRGRDGDADTGETRVVGWPNDLEFEERRDDKHRDPD